MTGFYNGSEINSKLDISEVVSKRVKLKKKAPLFGTCVRFTMKKPLLSCKFK